MSALTERIADVLKLDTVIATHCADRVYPFDIRQAGPQASATAEDASGFLYPTICVDDQGGARNAFAFSGTTEDTIAVWIMAERGYDGSGTGIIEAVANRVMVLMHGWQDGPTKTYLTYASRLGQQYDPAPDTGVIDRVTFRAASVLLTAQF